jgi:hypothetical protein
MTTTTTTNAPALWRSNEQRKTVEMSAYHESDKTELAAQANDKWAQKC